MADKPPVNEWNPNGYRFLVKPSSELQRYGETHYGYYVIYRWDPPAGYNPICEVFGMQMVDAKQQAINLASWYEETYPLALPLPLSDAIVPK